jgi:chromosome segregation ATPase
MEENLKELKEIKEGLKSKGKGKKLSEEEKAELRERYGVIKEIPEQIVEEVEVVEKKPERKEEIPEVLLKVERMDARVSAVEEYKKILDEKISRISEEIGELRSTFLALDKRFSSIEINAERVLKAVSEVKPEAIKGNFEKVDKEILETNARIERLNAMLESLKKEWSELKSAFDKIKNLENVLDVARKIEEKIAKVEEVSRYADRTAAKVEVVFSELSGKLGEIERQKGKIGKLDELTKEMVKMLDEISLRLPKFAEKGEIERALEEVEKKIQVSPKEFNEIKNAIKEGSLEISEMRKILEGYENKLKIFDERVGKIENVANSLESRIDSKIGDKLNAFESKINGISEEVRSFDSKFASMLNNMEILNKKVEDVSSLEISEIKNKLGENESKLKIFDERVGKIENAVNNLESRIDSKIGDKLNLFENKINGVIEEVRSFDSKFASMLNNMEILNKKVEDVKVGYEEKIRESTKIIEEFSIIAKNLMKAMEEESKRIKNIEKIAKINFEINKLQNLTTEEEVNKSLENIRNFVNEMKSLGIFDDGIKEFIGKSLLNFAENWSYYDENLSNLYLKEAKAYLS